MPSQQAWPSAWATKIWGRGCGQQHMLRTKLFMRQCNQILHFSELPLLVWTFMSSNPFYYFSSLFFILLLLLVSQHTFWPSPHLSEPVHCFLGETKKWLLSGHEYFSWSFLTWLQVLSWFFRKGETLLTPPFWMGPGRDPELWSISEIYPVSAWRHITHPPGPHRSFPEVLEH